ncbi:MAG TPA: glycosyltransferase [Anaerolineales bacterium]|nr:glycosyltransferase [Anaerolineales bacterium]
MAVKTAIVHDALPFYGGAERTLAAMLEVLPGVPVFTLVHNRAALIGTPLEGVDIRSSFLDRLPGIHANHYRYFPLFPPAVRSFDLRGFDRVIASHYAVANWARPAPGARFLSFMHTPLRYLWQQAGDRPAGLGSFLRRLAGPGRLLDRAAARRVDAFAANSRWIAGVVRRAYGRESAVVYPPVDVDRFSPAAQRDEVFICVSRLAAHKRLELVVATFNRIGLPLVVLGDGPERARLQMMAGTNIRFLGRLDDAAVAGWLGRARAFVHMAAEDFGIAVVEAQAAGCPVIAYAGGANRETVQDGVTGVLVPEQTPESLAAGIARFMREESRFEPELLRARARRFDKSVFKEAFTKFTHS